jgi:hypothetical protein
VTWSALLPVPKQASGCYLSVNPADALDIIVTENACLQDCFGTPQRFFFRSRDGGHTWNQLAIPHSGGAKLAFVQPKSSGEPPGAILAYSWAGTTLYATGIPYSGVNAFALYQSVNGGPLALLDLTQNPSAANVTRNNQLSASLFSLGHTIYLTLSGGCVPNCPFLTSADDGVTWQTITPQSAGVLEEISNAADGKTLVTLMAASDNTQQPMRSRDGGRTWQTFPPLPDGYDLQHASIAGSTPDGSLFIGASTTQTVAIYRLATGTNTWTPEYAQPQASSKQNYPTFAAVSADAGGHPKTIWSLLGDGSDTAILYQRPA